RTGSGFGSGQLGTGSGFFSANRQSRTIALRRPTTVTNDSWEALRETETERKREMVAETKAE
uniref:Uncharacterized protein n=1 Tax=Cucumis melo TaxID=3656 RepID=A0A9I9E3U4_CUCME